MGEAITYVRIGYAIRVHAKSLMVFGPPQPTTRCGIWQEGRIVREATAKDGPRCEVYFPPPIRSRDIKAAIRKGIEDRAKVEPIVGPGRISDIRFRTR